MCTKQPKSGFSTSPPERLDEALFSLKDKVALIINLILDELISLFQTAAHSCLLKSVGSSVLRMHSYAEAPVACVLIGHYFALSASPAVTLFLGVTFAGHNIPLKAWPGLTQNPSGA